MRFQLMTVAAVALIMNFVLPSGTMLSGIFLGSVAGFVLTGHTLKFATDGTAAQKVLRYLIGNGVAVLVYIAPKLILGDEIASGQPLVRFVRYGLLGFWISYGAPWLLTKLKLMSLEKSEVSPETTPV